MNLALVLRVILPLVLCFVLVPVPTHGENLLGHDESLKIVNLLDGILARLRDEIHGTQRDDLQETNTQLDEVEEEVTRINADLRETTDRIDYLESMRDAIQEDGNAAGRSKEQVENEIDLVHKIKKVLVGDPLATSCESDDQCKEGLTCDGNRCRIPIDGQCVASSECVASAECIYGTCISAVGRQCEVDSDCPSDTVCHEFKCSVNIGDECSQEDQCFTGVCQNRRCKARYQDFCTASLECEQGTVCDDHRCLLSRNEKCIQHSDCATGHCRGASPSTQDEPRCLTDLCQSVSCNKFEVCDPYEGHCRTPPGEKCSNSTQCMNELSCHDGKCMAQLHGRCESSEHCISGLCYNRHCKLPVNVQAECNHDQDCATGKCIASGIKKLCDAGEYSRLNEHKTAGRMEIFNRGTQVASDSYDHSRGSALLNTSNALGRWYFEVKCVDERDSCHGASFGIAERGHSNGVRGKHYGFTPQKQRIDSHRGNHNYGDGRISKGDVFGIDVDLDGGRIRFSKNGKFFGWRNDVESGEYFPAIWDHDSSHRDNLNMTVNAGFDSLNYAPPEKANRGWFTGMLLSKCAKDEECFGDLVCQNTQCKLPTQSPCNRDDSCASSFCVQNQCLYHLGEDCTSSSQCASGICRNRLCSVGSTSLLNLRSQMGKMEVSEYRTRVSWTRRDNDEGTILGEVGNESGKWYYEVECIEDCRGVTFGIASHSGHHDPSGRYFGWNPHHSRLRTSQGNPYYSAYYDMKEKDVAGVYVDLENSRIGFSMNGKWKGWSNSIPEGIYYPAIWDNDNNEFADIRVNFGHYDFQYYDDETFHKGWFGGSVLSSCQSNTDCEGKLVCYEAQCRKPLRGSCSNDKECSTPWCYNNQCLLKIGEHCSYGDECTSGHCDYGRCSTGQYTVFDPSATGGQVSLSAGFTEVDMNDRGCVLGSTSNKYQKWYYEVKCTSHTCHRLAAGIATDVESYQPSGDYYAYSFDYRCESHQGRNSLNSGNIKDGDVMGVAVDLENGRIGYYKNGDWLGWCFTSMNAHQNYLPVIYDNDNDQSTSAIVNFGFYDFEHEVPSGFNSGWYGGVLKSSCKESEETNEMHRCNSGLMCYSGYCVPKLSESCSNGDGCHGGLGSYCTISAHCGSGFTCDNNQCKAMNGQPCFNDDTCAGHSRCSPQYNCAAASCQNILENDPHAPSGEYELTLGPNHEIKRTYCDMEYDGGGWTLFANVRREHSPYPGQQDHGSDPNSLGFSINIDGMEFSEIAIFYNPYRHTQDGKASFKVAGNEPVKWDSSRSQLDFRLESNRYCVFSVSNPCHGGGTHPAAVCGVTNRNGCHQERDETYGVVSSGGGGCVDLSSSGSSTCGGWGKGQYRGYRDFSSTGGQFFVR